MAYCLYCALRATSSELSKSSCVTLIFSRCLVCTSSESDRLVNIQDNKSTLIILEKHRDSKVLGMSDPRACHLKFNEDKGISSYRLSTSKMDGSLYGWASMVLMYAEFMSHKRSETNAGRNYICNRSA